MQYILSENEMEDVRIDRLRLEKMPSSEGLVNVVRHVATTMIQTVNVNGRGASNFPHGCIHVKDPRGPTWQTEYCDGCQVAGICPQPKEWSK